MALNLSMIDGSISSYNKKIQERKIFVEKASKLVENAKLSSKKLGEASENLVLGLTIGGQPVDGGRLSEMASTIDQNVSTIENSISVANSEIRTYNSKVSFLNGERQRLTRLGKAEIE